MKQEKRPLLIWLGSMAALLLLALLAGGGSLTLRTGHISMLLITAILLLIAALIRLRIIPRFTILPGRFQLALETIAGALTPKPKPKAAPAPRYAAAVKKGPSLAKRLILLRNRAAKWIVANKAALALWLVILALLTVGTQLTGGHGSHGDVQVAMRDAVLHDVNRIGFLGLTVNPGLIAAVTVSCVLLVAALLIRLLVIPRFSEVPGKFQMILETIVGLLDGMAGVGREEAPCFIGGYVFAAGVYIFTSTFFELFGLQAIATNGHSVALPAPLSDVNAAIAMGCLSYLVILFGGLLHRGGQGAGAALKEFSLPISMSFRLFGALLSGLLVTELVYHFVTLSFVLPVVVGVMFTLLHALVQSYVLTMLVGMYYGEVTGRGEHEE